MEFGPGVAVTFLYYFSSTAVVLAFVVSQALDIGISTGIPQQFGAIGGLVAGILGTYFNRTVRFELPIKSEQQFFNRLEPVLDNLGYQQVEDAEDDSEKVPGLRVYERTALSKWFSGRIFVQVEGQQATIASRAVVIRTLKQVLT
ncbi:MAG: hypothetical protein MUF72_22700 [Elainella sp. Prado103]|jgi:hypothetical protein|nr:hypothetical protein [Elainella sp. Prado103]